MSARVETEVEAICPWTVQVLDGQGFEVSIVRADLLRPEQKLWGWFDENKVLVCAGPAMAMDKQIKRAALPRLIRVAEGIADDMNKKDMRK